MTSKRLKVTRAADKRSAASKPASDPNLVSEVHNMLLQSSRKELAHLLSGLLKSVSSEILEQVRAEALKIGAAKVVSAPFQTCSHTQLDSVFSFLNERDLRVAETVCRRWQAACRDSNAGWIAALGRGTEVEDDDFCTLAARRLSFAAVWRSPKLHLMGDHEPSSLVKVAQSTVINEIILEAPDLETKQLDPLASMTQLRTLDVEKCKLSELKCLPQLTHLKTHAPVNASELALLAKLTKLQVLNCELRQSFANLPENSFPRLKELTLVKRTVTTAEELNAIYRISNLQALSIQEDEDADPPSLEVYQALSRFTRLTSLGFTANTDNYMKPLSSLTGLTKLTLFDETGSLQGQFLRSFVNLRELRLPASTISLQTASHLLHLPQLRSLKLADAPLSSVWPVLAKSSIRNLELDFDPLQSQLSSIASIKTLKELICYEASTARRRLVKLHRSDIVVTDVD